MAIDIISPETLRKLLFYNSETGVLIWRERAMNALLNGIITKAWNTKYSGKSASYLNRRGYKALRVLGVNLLAHRVCFAIYYGRWPSGHIDHIDGDKVNNAITNLREVSDLQNARNAKLRSDNRYGCPGLTLTKYGWAVQIGGSKNRQHIGTFKLKEEAIRARADAEKSFGYHENHGRR
jgi:hypothetical protein